MWLLANAGPKTVCRPQLVLLVERSKLRVERQWNLRTVCGEGRSIALRSYEKRAKCMVAISLATVQAATIRLHDQAIRTGWLGRGRMEDEDKQALVQNSRARLQLWFLQVVPFFTRMACRLGLGGTRWELQVLLWAHARSWTLPYRVVCL